MRPGRHEAWVVRCCGWGDGGIHHRENVCRKRVRNHLNHCCNMIVSISKENDKLCGKVSMWRSKEMKRERK